MSQLTPENAIINIMYILYIKCGCWTLNIILQFYWAITNRNEDRLRYWAEIGLWRIVLVHLFKWTFYREYYENHAHFHYLFCPKRNKFYLSAKACCKWRQRRLKMYVECTGVQKIYQLKKKQEKQFVKSPNEKGTFFTWKGVYTDHTF